MLSDKFNTPFISSPKHNPYPLPYSPYQSCTYLMLSVCVLYSMMVLGGRFNTLFNVSLILDVVTPSLAVRFHNDKISSCKMTEYDQGVHKWQYSRFSLSRNRRDPQKHLEISVLRHIRFVVLSQKIFEQPNFTNYYVI